MYISGRIIEKLAKEGLVIVPRIPTEGMQKAGWYVAEDHIDFWDYGGYTGAGYTFEDSGPKAIWEIMIKELEKERRV